MTTSNELVAKGENLRGLWQASMAGFCPPPQQFGTWLLIHNDNDALIAWGIRELAIKLTKKQMNDDHKVRFVSSVMNRKAHEVRP